MDAYLLEWLNLLLRWTHFIVGVAWIGSSFYFVWLDSNLNRPPRDPENEQVAGDLWAVHGGGFYHAQKYQVAPKELPAPLHWFKWEAYTTWLTGFALLLVLYYCNADVYLVDRNIADITASEAVMVSVALLVASWIVYDLLCKTRLDDRGIAIIGFSLLVATIYGVAQVFGGRGAYMQIGAMLGTIMAANVFFVIIPGQKELVAAKERGEEPDPVHGIRGKQRSIHNNYLTLPVLFTMLSNHYPMLYAHVYSWLLLVCLFIVGIVVRLFFNFRNQGKFVPLLPIAALGILIVMAIAIAPPSLSRSAMDKVSQATPGKKVSFTEVRSVIIQRCVNCHSATPGHPTAPVAPNGVMLDTAAEIQQWSSRIYERTVVTRTMPLANLTTMTDEEREIIARWYEAGAGSDD